MKFFHIFYTLYDTKGQFVDYGIKQLTYKTYPKFTELHDVIGTAEQPYRVAITNIEEVTLEEYYENLTEEEETATNQAFMASVLGDIKVLDADEMDNLGLDEERIVEIGHAVEQSINDSGDFDVLILRFISSVIKQYAESKTPCSPTVEYYERFGIPYDGDVDKFTFDQMVMSYKVDLVKLADSFDMVLEALDNDEYKPSTMYTAFNKLSKMLPGMWN